MTTWQGMLAATGRIVAQNRPYDNSVPGRCAGWGLDCATFAALAVNEAGGVIDPCTNSWSMTTLCRNTPRPQWLTALVGPGVGTQIPQEIALAWPGTWWFHMTGAGHVEIGTGFAGGLPGSVGAHSHATGIGYSHWWPGFFDDYYVPPMLLDSFEQTYAVPPPPKVPPMFSPNLSLAARLRNPGLPGHQIGGWWEGYDNGIVDFLGDDGSFVRGGMISPNDLKNFAAHGERLSHLTLRKRPNGHWGYLITATDGNPYTPEAQA